MPANEILAILMFVSFIALVFTGFPVAWILGGLAVLFSAFAVVLEVDFALPTGIGAEILLRSDSAVAIT